MQDKGFFLSLKELNNIFPYYILLDQNLNIEKVGNSLRKLFPEVKLKNNFFDNWNIVRPKITSENHNEFQRIIGDLCVINFKNRPELLLKGHFENIENSNQYIFYGNPAFNSTSQILENNLTLSDFSLNDTTFDFLHILRTNEIANEELKELLKKINDQKKDLALFKQIMDNSSDAIQVALDNGDMYYINKVSSERLGIPLKEVRNFSVFDFEKKFINDKNAWFEHVEELKRKNFLTLESLNLNQKTGKLIPVEITIKYSKVGEIGLIAAISRDISERKQNEKNLKLQEEKYRNIISNMNLGLLEVDNNGLILFCNQSFERICGYTLEELKGKDAANFLGKGEVQNLLNKKVDERKNKTSDSYEVLVKNKRGEAKWWLISGGANVNDSGEVTGSIGIHLDITEQKQLELDLEDALHKSQEASRAKETFLANMSHEIRTPLNGILGMIKALKLEQLNNQQASYVESAQIASEHLLSIINNILDITKIEAGELELINKSFSLTKVVDDIKHILRNQINRDNIEFNTKLVNVAPALLGDEVRLRQILINLLGNSIKFTEKGTVSLLCTGGEINHGEQELKIEITDTGIGIDKEALSKVFQKFQQEDVGISRKFGGTGLGLVITKELVDLMGGKLNLSSEKGVGTKIEILLKHPLGKEIEVKEETVDMSLFKGLKILLVEDSDMNRLVVKHTLSQTDVLLTEVINGKEAIEQLNNEAFDLILMDIQMPIMGGIEATKIIRNELKQNIPIIALSANAFKSEIDACLAIGFNDYIVKPFKQNTLLNVILKFTNKTSMIIEDSKIYNLDELENLATGNQEFMNSMIDLFIDITPKSVQEMQDAFKTKDYDTLKKVAHRIKPSIDNMGIISLKDPIRHLEKFDLKTEGLQELKTLVGFISKTLFEVISQLKAIKNSV